MKLRILLLNDDMTNQNVHKRIVHCSNLCSTITIKLFSFCKIINSLNLKSFCRFATYFCIKGYYVKKLSAKNAVV